LKPRNLVILLAALALGLTGCRGPGTVRKLVPSPSGARHAALLVVMGGATVGASCYVVALEGDPPPLGSEIPIRNRCVLWRAYNVGPWKMIWESENQLALAIDGPIRKDYEEMIKLSTCDGISARWYFEEERK
jgi:hypothetical protein